MTSALQVEKRAEGVDPSEDLLDLLRSDEWKQKKSEERFERIQDQINAIYVQLIHVFTEPLADRMEPFLAHVRRGASVFAGTEPKNFQGDSSYYLGQLHAIAELAEMVRHEKMPRPAAEVLIRHGDAQTIARIVFERGSIGLTQLAEELQKKSQNLNTVLREMQAVQLVRRDELGRNVLYSPTPLTRTAVYWGAAEEQETLAAGSVR
jgi:Cu/Ag efflux pump CusA